MHDVVRVAVGDGLEDLLHALRRVRLAVELARHDVLEQLAARHPTRAPVHCGQLDIATPTSIMYYYFVYADTSMQWHTNRSEKLGARLAINKRMRKE